MLHSFHTQFMHIDMRFYRRTALSLFLVLWSKYANVPLAIKCWKPLKLRVYVYIFAISIASTCHWAQLIYNYIFLIHCYVIITYTRTERGHSYWFTPDWWHSYWKIKENVRFVHICSSKFKSATYFMVNVEKQSQRSIKVVVSLRCFSFYSLWKRKDHCCVVLSASQPSRMSCLLLCGLGEYFRWRLTARHMFCRRDRNASIYYIRHSMH